MRIRWRPALICLALCALGVVLGLWQLGRADYKRNLEALRNSRQQDAPLRLAGPLSGPMSDGSALEWRRAVVRGEFVPGWTVYLDNRQQAGQTGVWVLTPFKLAGTSQYLLVARGWLPRNAQERGKIAAYSTPTGQIQLQGVLHRQPARLLQLGRDVALAPLVLRQNLTLDELARASGLPLLPLLLEQSAAADQEDVLGRDWPQASAGIEKHQGYAFQWFALAGVALVFLVLTGWHRAGR
jgi:cytochrome oxidase assembly protein ShyY1